MKTATPYIYNTYTELGIAARSHVDYYRLYDGKDTNTCGTFIDDTQGDSYTP